MTLFYVFMYALKNSRGIYTKQYLFMLLFVSESTRYYFCNSCILN